MRLSIWHQFSSNHSSGFTIVGQFQTEAEAQHVAEVIRSILQQAAEWHEATRAAIGEDVWNLDNPIEDILRYEYGLTTENYPIDYATQPDKVREVVRTLGNIVFVAEDFIDEYTWTGDKPFTELMQKLGGNVAVSSESRDTNILVTLSYHAPDEQIANQLVDAPQHIDHGWSYVRLPIPIELKVNNRGDSEYPIGTIHRDGLKVTFTDLEPFGISALEFFAILAYLESLGCTDFEYSFREIKY